MAMLLGLALVGGAVYVAVGQVDWSSLGQASTADLLKPAAAVAANLILTGLLLHVITRSFNAKPPVQANTMIKLVCVSGLLNMLPLRPGLLGRAAYLKAKHELPLHQSVLCLLITFILGGLVLGVTSAAVLLAPAEHAITAMWTVLVLLALISPLTGLVARRVLQRPIINSWLWTPLRIADMLAGGVKLYLAFKILGQPIAFEQALALRAVGSLVDMLPITPNGLGLREWVQGGLASWSNIAQGPVGIAASLIERAVEAIVLILLGLISMALLRRQPATS